MRKMVKLILDDGKYVKKRTWDRIHVLFAEEKTFLLVPSLI